MACPRSIELLQQIVDELTSKRSHPETGRWDEWTYYKVGKNYFFKRTVTYSGSLVNVTLDIKNSMKINSFVQVWNDATAKDFNVQISSTPSAAVPDWLNLDAQVANTATDRGSFDVQALYPPGSRMRFVYTNFTVGKIVVVFVNAEEL